MRSRDERDDYQMLSHAARGLLSVRDSPGVADGAFVRAPRPASCCSRRSRFPRQIKAIFESEPNIQQIARKYAQSRDFLFLGRGINYPIALEGALKLKEISYIHAEGYSAGEMKHGPIALIDDKMPVVVIIPNDGLFEKSMSNLKEVESRNGRIIAVTNHATAELKNVAAEVIEVPETNRLLTPVLMTVPLQLLAYHIASERGTDVDQPRNLAKSVTVE